MIWILSSWRRVRSVSEHLPDFENAGGRAAISLLFAKTRLVLSCEAATPRQPIFAKQNWKGPSYRDPFSTV
jgi:hypothetical protein